MKKEKKLNARQKIALERIYRLFELAQNAKDENLETTYIKLAKRIGEKTNISIPKELKKTFCKECYSLHVKKQIKGPFLIITCSNCKFEKKFGNTKE